LLLFNQVDVDYENLLCVDGVRLYDPWQLVDGWMGESVGVPLWPPCMYVNIADYLIEHDERALLTRLGNDYKEGKLITSPRALFLHFLSINLVDCDSGRMIILFIQ